MDTRMTFLSLCRGLVLLLAVLDGVSLQGQQVQLVSKKIETSYPYRAGYELNLEGEKAEIRVEAWDKQEVGIQIEMISRHPDKTIAEKALSHIQYKIERVDNRIYIRNYLSENPDPAQNAQLHVKYFIRVPAQCPVYVKNIYGIATFQDLASSLRIFSQFTRLGLDNIRGELEVSTRFGDLEGRHLEGNLSIESRRSDLRLSHVSGNLDLDTYYGKIFLSELEGLLDLNITAEKSDIFLEKMDSRLFGYQINATNAQLNLPSDLPFVFAEGSEGTRKATYKPAKEIYPSISITIRLGSLTMNR
ncbi:MAG: DUF4097 domain-containing protein [Saprospiraceae bacterium]|nr:DUF4097 domain-containing protein [Saprospiraceae bacterium]